ncbi:MAG: dTDP-4-dehydrorhamnose reductase [Flavobacteriaceae bacterium]
MKIAVIGKNGQLATCLKEVAPSELDISFYGSVEVDITKAETYTPLISADLIINCSAYTAVDKAEECPEDAYAVNRMGVIQLVQFCEQYQIKLIHFSTDFVFEGEANTPYTEDSFTGPKSIYGASKLAGEEVILQSALSALVIRTSWLYSPLGHNFCKTMLRLGAERSELLVVNDQIGTPTSALDLARVVFQMIESGLPDIPELFHVSNTGQCSWADFAREIFNQKELSVSVNNTTTEAFNAPAPRPKYSVLSTEKLLFTYGIAMRPWRDSLKEVLSAL